MSYLERESYHSKRIGQKHYKVLVDAIQDHRLAPDPEAVLEIGCSAGMLIGQIRAQYRLGIDASYAAQAMFEELCPECHFEHYDLEHDTYWLGHYDLIVCLEVAEHVKNTENLMRLVNESSGPGCIMVWSAAPLGQRGLGHVTLKPYRWWRRKMDDGGWSLDAEATDRFRASIKGKVPEHYYLNTRIYRK